MIEESYQSPPHHPKITKGGIILLKKITCNIYHVLYSIKGFFDDAIMNVVRAISTN